MPFKNLKEGRPYYCASCKKYALKIEKLNKQVNRLKYENSMYYFTLTNNNQKTKTGSWILQK